MKIARFIFILLVFDAWKTSSAKFSDYVSKKLEKYVEKFDEMVNPYPKPVKMPTMQKTMYLAKNVLLGLPMEAGLKTVGIYCEYYYHQVNSTYLTL